MKHALRNLTIGIAALAAAGPVQAADWWLVSGVPENPVAIFADVDTLSRNGNHAQIHVLRIDRLGRAYETVQQIQCSRGSGSVEGEDVRQFACASPGERDEHGLILAAMNPMLVARMIFATDPTVTADAARKAEPRS